MLSDVEGTQAAWPGESVARLTQELRTSLSTVVAGEMQKLGDSLCEHVRMEVKATLTQAQQERGGYDESKFPLSAGSPLARSPEVSLPLDDFVRQLSGPRSSSKPNRRTLFEDLDLDVAPKKKPSPPEKKTPARGIYLGQGTACGDLDPWEIPGLAARELNPPPPSIAVPTQPSDNAEQLEVTPIGWVGDGGNSPQHVARGQGASALRKVAHERHANVEAFRASDSEGDEKVRPTTSDTNNLSHTGRSSFFSNFFKVRPSLTSTISKFQQVDGDFGKMHMRGRKSITARMALQLAKPQKDGIGDKQPSAQEISTGDITWKQLLCLFVVSDLFDYIVSVLLIANAITIGASTEFKARNRNAALPQYLRQFEQAFCALFTIELVLRISVMRMHFFLGPNRLWGFFDTVLVVLQLMEEFSMLVWDLDSVGAESSVLDIVKFMRFLRLLRIIRVMRLVRFVSELRKLMYLIVASFWSFVWTIVLLGMLTYMVAVFVTQLVVDSYSSFDESPEQDSRITFWFGGVFDTINSLYQAITGGVDWGDMSHALMTEVNPWCGILFYMYVAFSVLVLLNLVTGVFVDGAMRLTKSDRQAELVRKIHRAFQMSDSDGSGTISFTEFRNRIECDDVKSLFAAIEMNINRAEDLFKILDEDDSGELTAEEFAMGSLQLQAPAKALDVCLMTHQMARGFENIRRCMELLLLDRFPVWSNCQGITGIVDRYRKTDVEALPLLGHLRRSASDESIDSDSKPTQPKSKITQGLLFLRGKSRTSVEVEGEDASEHRQSSAGRRSAAGLRAAIAARLSTATELP